MIIFVGSEKMAHKPNGKHSPPSFLTKKGKERQREVESREAEARCRGDEGGGKGGVETRDWRQAVVEECGGEESGSGLR